MTPEQLQPRVLIMAGAFLALAVVLFAWSLVQFRYSRTDLYWRRRRTAGQRGLRALVVAIVLLIASGLLWGSSAVASLLYLRNASQAITASPAGTIAVAQGPTATPISLTVTAGISPSAIPTLVPTQPPTFTRLPPSATLPPTPLPPSPSLTNLPPSVTPLPPATATTSTISTTAAPATTAAAGSGTPAGGTAALPVSPTPSPTASIAATAIPPSATQTSSATATYTATPTLTFTPSITPTATVSPTETLKPVIISNLTLESSVTPGPNAILKITALDTQLSASFSPVAPAESFPAGFSRIYFFVTYSGMQPGILWRRELVKDDKVVLSGEYLWGQQQDGTAFFFFGQEGGFKAGQYKIRLYLGQIPEPITEKSFTVR